MSRDCLSRLGRRDIDRPRRELSPSGDSWTSSKRAYDKLRQLSPASQPASRWALVRADASAAAAAPAEPCKYGRPDWRAALRAD